MKDNFERVVICSVFEANRLQLDKQVANLKLEPLFFENPFHKKIVAGINRLVELNYLVDELILREQFIKAGKWSLQEDDALLNIMAQTPFATYEQVMHYYKMLEKSYFVKKAVLI